jgi:hypothetical protein
MPLTFADVVWKTLAPDAQTALKIVQRMKDANETLGRASRFVTNGLPSWSPERFRAALNSASRGVSAFSGEAGEYAALAGEYEALIAEGTGLAGTAAEAGGLLGLATTIGEWLGFMGEGAAVAGSVAVAGAVVVAGVVVYGASNYLGSRMGAAPISAGANGDATARLLAGNYELSWTWSVTSVYFTGSISGGPGQWTYQGVLNGRAWQGNDSWHPKKGSATVSCTLNGQPGQSGTLSCTANFPGQQAWQGTASGQIGDDTSRLSFSAGGNGTGGDGKPAHIDSLELDKQS